MTATPLLILDLLGLAIPVVTILYMLKFSQSYPDRVTHEPAEVPAGPSGR